MNCFQSVFQNVIVRFCGPATTVQIHSVQAPRLQVEIRTLAQAIQEVGDRMTTFVLFPEQVEILEVRYTHIIRNQVTIYRKC